MAPTLFRQSYLKVGGGSRGVPVAAAAQYADATDAAFRDQQWLGALRLPGRAEVPGGLGRGRRRQFRGDKLAIDALWEADAKRRNITERLGVEKQKAAYRHSLGLE